MTYNYKTQELVEKGVNFNNIFAEKQDFVKDMTGYEFNLQQIVKFLENQTNNFTKQMPLALDIDRAIYNIYLKWKSTGKEEEETSMPKQQPKEETSPQVTEWIEAIETLQMLVEAGGSDENIAEWKDAIETLNMLLETEEPKMANGGYIEKENALMVANNNKQIAHHAKEMANALKNKKNVPAWVVAKVNRSATDLSDATHYLEGEEGKYAQGGKVVNLLNLNNKTVSEVREMLFKIDLDSETKLLVEGVNGDYKTTFGRLKRELREEKNQKSNSGIKNIIFNFESKMAKGGGVDVKIPPQGTMISKDKKNKLDYKKVGNNYEFIVYEGEASPVENYSRTSFNKKTNGVVSMNYSQFINYINTEGYVYEKMAQGGGVGRIVMIPTFVVKEIKDSVKMGYDNLVEGMIGRKRKGVMLINENYEVRGTYDIGLKDAIQDLINQIKSGNYKVDAVDNKMAQGGGVKEDFRGSLSTDALPYLLKDTPYRYQIEGENVYGTLKEIEFAKKFLKDNYNIDSTIRDKNKVGFKKLEVLEQIIDYAKGGGVEKVGKVMHEFKEGTLHSGKSGKIVKDPRQAIAIALSEAGLSKK